MALTPEQVTKFYKNQYGGPNLVISLAGHVNHEKVLESLKDKLPLSTQIHPISSLREQPKNLPFRDFIYRPSEQVHILVGLPSSSYKEKTRFESYIVNALLGGGMTSKLYQKVREDRGLAYLFIVISTPLLIRVSLWFMLPPQRKYPRSHRYHKRRNDPS